MMEAVVKKAKGTKKSVIKQDLSLKTANSSQKTSKPY